MATLALVQQGTTLGVEGEIFVVSKGRGAVERVRMHEVDEILAFGHVALTPAAVAAALARGIDTVFLSRRGRYRGRLVAHGSRNVALRAAQFDALRDAVRATAIARAIVAGKLVNQRQVLLRAQREHGREELARPIAELCGLAARAATAVALDELRGIEGRGAAVYFGAFGACLRNPQFAFTRRTRRPPRDPVNAILSFGYTLLGIVMESDVMRVGLDPMLGALHAPEHGRLSLVLDLIEEFRPLVVDALALRLVNRREIAPEDFEDADPVEDVFGAADDVAEGPDQSPASTGQNTSAEGSEEPGPGTWLSETGRRVFFRAWGRRLREIVLYPAQGRRLTVEEIMRQQAYQVASVLRGETSDYVPFATR